MRKAITILLSSLISVLPLLANDGSNKHIMKWLRIEEGLSNNFIMSLDMDKYGILWIGTEEGMNRFDGVAFKSFAKHSGAIPGNALNKVISDRFDDKVWIATQRSGLASYNYSTGESFVLRHNDTTDNSIPSDEITNVVQDDDGNIWFSTYTEGIGKYNQKNGKITLYNSTTVEGMLNSTIRRFIIGRDNKIYAAYYGRGIIIIDPEKMSSVSYTHIPGNSKSLPSNEIGSIYQDKDNNIWVGTRKGLALFRQVTKDFTIFDKNNSGIPDGIIFSILVTSENKLLASPAFNGVWEMNLNDITSNSTFTQLADTDEIRNLGIHAMLEDRFGNLWLGSYGNGILFISHKTSHFLKRSYPSGLSERSVTNMDFMDNGNMIVATDGGGIDILDKNLDNIGKSDTFIADKSVLSTAWDSDGHCWIGSFNGEIAVIDSNMNLLSTVGIREVRSFYQSGDTMWVASGLSGLYSVDRKEYKILNRYTRPFFPDSYLKSICMDRNNNLWIGTFRSGLFIFGQNMNTIANFNTDTGFPSNSINHLFLDSRGDMWVATGEGLVHFKTGDKIAYDKIFTGKDGLSSESIGAIVEDENNTIWFSTNLSICHINPKSGTITEYGYQSGIAKGNYAPSSSAIRDDGMICFGSTEGITCFFPNQVVHQYSDISIHFSEIQIFDSNNPIAGENETLLLSGKNSIELRHWQNGFNISFAVDDYGLSDNVQYSYKVAGKDNNWYILPNNNYVSFHQLPPGKYTLYVRARTTDNPWSEMLTSLSIRIRPPFYASIAAYILYAIMALGITGLIISLCISKLKKDSELKLEKASIAQSKEINEERLRFYTNITHELKTPLTLILGPTEDILNDESLPASTKKKISVVHKNASSLLELINQLLNFRKAETNNVIFKPSYGNLSTFIEDIITIFSESSSNNNVEIKLDIARNIYAIFDFEIMTTVINNLMSNAMKYTPSGSVTVGLKTENDSEHRIATISVADTGLGISKDQYEKIFERFYQIPGRQQARGTGIGLSVVKNLVTIHHGTISVMSEKNKGSIFIVKIPIEPITDNKDIKSYPESDIDADSTRPIIVVAEDNDDIREYIKESLSDTYDIFTAKNGLEGYSLSCRYIPDIIVSDIMMPVMDGWALCEKVKQDIKLSHIPVIFLTAKDTIEDRVEGYKVGADSYIPKPFTSEILRARISNLLESRKKLAQQFVNSVHVNNSPAEQNQNIFSEVDNEFIKKVTNYIEDNLSSEDLDIGAIAENMNMSPSTLYRKLKALLGISAVAFIRKVKMRKAAEMLSSGNFNVSETAWNVGINSMIYFRQCFKDEYGISPSEFKNKH